MEKWIVYGFSDGGGNDGLKSLPDALQVLRKRALILVETKPNRFAAQVLDTVQ